MHLFTHSQLSFTGQSSLTGATNLFLHEKYNLEDAYNKFCCRRKLKDQLSSFLPNLPGNGIDNPAPNDSSSLRSLIEKPPICGKELLHLTPNQLTGFRLHPGPLPEQYRFMATTVKAKKHKKQKREKDVAPVHDSLTDPNQEAVSHEKKHGKKRKHDDEREKERKKKKKEKKRKKMKHSPDSSTATAAPTDRSSSL
jgi:mediator of RNA polymerase II transcription subunit 19